MEETVIPYPFPGRNLMTELGIEIIKRGEDGAVGRLALSEAAQQGAVPIFHGGAIIALADTVATSRQDRSHLCDGCRPSHRPSGRSDQQQSRQ